MKTNLVSRAVHCALLVGAAAALASPMVLGQETGSPSNQNQVQQSAQNENVSLKKVLVTGSLIPRTSVETAAPVTVITAKQIQASGLTSIADVMRTLSADNSGTIPNAFSIGFANGSSGIALRGLTVNSTLVLIDGRRSTAYPLADDGQRSFTDLDTIPLNAVERIEVLKDGASSIYGADAIAGVINIILYPSWSGSRASAQIGGSQHGGGASQDYTFITGTGNLDTSNWNAYLSVEYHTQRPIYYSKRGFPLDACDTSSLGFVNQCVGGNPAFGGPGFGTSRYASVYGVVAPATVSGTNPDGSPNLLTGVQVPGTSFQPLRTCPTQATYPGTGPGTGTGCTYNQIANYLEIAPETDSYSIDGRITVNLNATTTAYLNASYNQFRSVSTGAGSAADGFIGYSPIQNNTPTNTNDIVLPPLLPNGTLNANDPFATNCAGYNAPGPGVGINAPGCQYAKISYAFGDLPQNFPSVTTVNHVMRMDADVSGALSQNWNYDLALNLNHAFLNYTNWGILHYPQLIADVTDGTYNFVDPSQNSQAMRSAIAPPDAVTATTDEDELDFSINGDLVDLPGGPLGLGVGAQWRYEAQDDPSLNPGNLYQGLGSAQTIGHRNVAAVFAELDAPVLPSLEFDLSAREDHYSDFGSAFSPKFGVKWTPIQQLALRGTYSRGFRAPSFSENGSSSSLGFTTFNPSSSAPAWVNEHCATGSPPGTPTKPCTPDAYAAPYSIATFSEANPDIQPERSRSYTLGLVFQPASGLSGTLDYYNINKTNVIAPPSPGGLISQYFAGSPLPPGSVIVDVPDPQYPNATPRPIQFNAEYLNENELHTSGFDVELRYVQEFNGLNFTSDFHGTKIATWCETLEEGGPCISMVGTQGPYELSSGAGTPKYRWNWANTLTVGPASITATVYWVSGISMTAPDAAPPGLCLATGYLGTNSPPDCQVPAFYYLDLTGIWKFNNNWALTAGILNATDRSAPYDPLDYAGNNYSPTYAQAGAVGRFYQLGLQVKF